MPRNPKLFIKGTLIEVSSRIEEGLPLVPNELTCLIIGSILARAQNRYPVTMVAYSFMENHFHMLLIVHNPKDIPDFIGYFKRESAHAINRMIGRRQRTIWCEGFDNPVILDSETAIKRLNYIYLNPVEAGLTPKAENWPLSSASWVDFNKTRSTRKFKPIPRNKIPLLPKTPLSQEEINTLCRELMDLPGEYYTLMIQPHAWKYCFKDMTFRKDEDLNKLVFRSIRQEEERLSQEKEKEGSSYPTLEYLQRQDMRRPYTPKKFGKRMLCLAADKMKRILYLQWLKETYQQLPRFLKERGIDFKKTLHYPPGFFAPGGFLSANLLPMHTPIAFIT
jgi:REP element-mobilizing transposase RayT